MNKRLATNTIWLTGGNFAKVVIQAAYFVIIARTLGPAEYGAFVAVAAAVAMVGPFVGVGANILLIKNVSRDSCLFAVAWGNGLLVTSVTGGMAFVALTFCSFLLPTGIGRNLLVLVALSDLVFQRVTDLSASAFGAHDRFAENAVITLLFQATRLGGLLWMVMVISHPSVYQWAGVYLCASSVASMISVVWVTVALGLPTVNLKRLRGEVLEGFYFASGIAAQTIYNDIDKTMLGRLSTLTSTGIYGAAYRIVDVSLVPIRSLLLAAYPGTFRAGKDGIAGSIKYMKGMLSKAGAYAMVATVAILLFAPIVPHILGKEYQRTVEALRWLAVLPVLKALQFFLADSLSGSGHQGVRTLLQTVTAAFNVGVNFWIIRAYSWRGAAWSSIASDLMLTMLLIAVVKRIAEREKRKVVALVER